MKITYVTETHGMLTDEKQSVDVVTHEEFNNGIVKTHGAKIAEGERQIERLWYKIENFNERVQENFEKISVLENGYNCIPQALRDALGVAVQEVFADKLALQNKLKYSARNGKEFLRNWRECVRRAKKWNRSLMR